MKIRSQEEKIVDYSEKLKPEIDGMIEKYLPKRVTKKWLNFTFGKPRYIFSKKAVEESLIKPIWNFISRGGKRWRPILFLLVTEAVGGNIEKVKDFLLFQNWRTKDL